MSERNVESAESGLDAVLSCGRTQCELARLLGIKQPAIAKWRSKGYVPIERVPAVEAVTGVARWRIRPDRPDLFPPPVDVRRDIEVT